MEEEVTKQRISQEEAIKMAGEIVPESFFEESATVTDKSASSKEPPSNRQTGGGVGKNLDSFYQAMTL